MFLKLLCLSACHFLEDILIDFLDLIEGGFFLVDLISTIFLKYLEDILIVFTSSSWTEHSECSSESLKSTSELLSVSF